MPGAERSYIVRRIVNTHRFRARLEKLAMITSQANYDDHEFKNYSRLAKYNYGTGRHSFDHQMAKKYLEDSMGALLKEMLPTLSLSNCIQGYEHRFAHEWAMRRPPAPH